MKRMLVLLVLIAACPKSRGPDAVESFRVFFPDAGPRGVPMTVGKRTQAKPAANCRTADGREARWANTGVRIEKGELPPGLVIEDGAIAGVPAIPGSWQLTLTFTGVTCATKSMPDQTVDVALTIAAAK